MLAARLLFREALAKASLVAVNFPSFYCSKMRQALVKHFLVPSAGGLPLPGRPFGLFPC